MTPTILLIRATALDARIHAFADTLAAASGCTVAFVTDEDRGPTLPTDRPVAGVSVARCEALGLHCPADFAWKCGDYGYYVARARFPAATHFWMIEYDVRFAGGDVGSFFASFATRPEVDFLAAFLGPATWDWHWAVTARARDVRPTRCLFPVTRLSARAIDALHAKRVAHGRRPLRRFLWPNDEALVATTLCHSDFTCRDLNDFVDVWYDAQTFSFTQPIDGDRFIEPSNGLKLFHPVLYGEQYRRKLARLAEAQAPRAAMREAAVRIVAKINSLTSW